MAQHRSVFSVAAIIAFGLSLSACSNESNPMPIGGTSAGASVGTVTPGITAPVGPFPRGTLSPANMTDPATVGPEISWVSPDRGAQVSGNSVEARVQVSDVDGVVDVQIGGAADVSNGLVPAVDGGNGEWLQQLTLSAGMNLIHVSATDGLGNVSTSYISVTAGSFLPLTQPVSDSVGVALTAAGLDRVGDIAQQQLAGLNLYSLVGAANPIFSTSVVEVSLLNLTHDPMGLALDSAPNGLTATITLDNVDLSIDVNALGIAITQGTITADQVTAVAQATVSQSAFTGTGVGKSALGLQINSLSLSFQNFQMSASSGLINTILQPFVGQLQGVVEDLVGDALLDMIDQQLSQTLTGIDTPATITFDHPLSGSPTSLDLQVEVTESQGSSLGDLSVQAGFLMTVPQGTGILNGTRNAYVNGTTVSPQTLTPGPEPFAVAITDDALNRALHALWLSDLLRVNLDWQTPLGANTQGVAINVGYLYAFIPAIRDLAPDPDTPLRIEVSTAAAPVGHFGRDPSEPVAIDVGEAQVKVLIDYMDGQPPAELFELRLSTTLSANVTLANNELTINNLAAPHLGVDIISEPLGDLNDQEIEDFLHGIVPWIMNRYSNQIPALPIPALPLGLNLTNASLEFRPNMVVLRGSL